MYISQCLESSEALRHGEPFCGFRCCCSRSIALLGVGGFRLLLCRFLDSSGFGKRYDEEYGFDDKKDEGEESWYGVDVELEAQRADRFG